jgi:type I restriction enzyme S subunit
MTEWRQFKLKDILEPDGYIRGPFGSSLRRGELKNEGIPVYEQEHAIKGIRKFRYYIDQNKFNELKRFCVKTGDIIISCSGTVGEVSVIKEEDPKGIISQALLILRADKNVAYQPFLKYFLMSPYGKSSITSRSDGSVQVNIAKRQVIENIDILLPPLTEQKAIAEVLSSLDDKIDLLIRQNKTLEDLAQAYFRKWFIEDASDKWEVGKLGDFVEVIDNRGKTPPYQDIPTEYPIIEVKSISGDNRFIDYQKCEKFVLESTYKTWFRGYIKPLDVLVSTVGSVGEIAQVLLEHGVIAQNVIGLRSKGTSPYHLFEYMKYMKNEIKELDIGSVQPSIKVPHLLSLQYVKPDRDSLRKFDDFSKELVNKMISNFMQIQTLQKLRDTLLPKLISGEIRVKM